MLRERSWASSMMIVSYARSSRSVWISASRMPSVMSLTKVPSGFTWSVKRTFQPTASPRGVQLLRHTLGDRAGGDAAGLGVADHAADAAAQFRQILGIWVVFPEPVSPATMTTWWSRMASAMSDFFWLTGSCSG